MAVEPRSPSHPSTRSRSTALVVTASMTAGVLGAALLTLGPFAGAGEAAITGSVLLAFGCGWALLAALTARLTPQPQRWAWLPAGLMIAAGLALAALSPGAEDLTVAGWVWPPVTAAVTVFSIVRMRRTLTGRGRWVLYPVFAALVLASIGGAFASIAQVRESGGHPMPGRSYDVAGRQMHLDCRGSGSPTVLLQGGLGEMSSWWSRISPTVAHTTRVCAYDRAGQGWSDDSTEPKDGLHAAEDLHRLMEVAHEDGPYVLVGHSIGGTYAMTYAARYPADVAGVVLLDSSSPEQFTAIPAFSGSYAVMRRVVALLPTLSRVGLTRLVPASSVSALPEPAAEDVRAFSMSARGLRNFRDEQAAIPDLFAQAQALTSLGGSPLVVVTASETLGDEGWGEAQDRLADLSTNTSHRVADASHAGLLDSDTGSKSSIRAIEDVVESVRTRSPISGAGG